MSIARNTGYNIAGALLPTAVTLVTVPMYLKVIGIERYGVLSLCWLMLGYVNFLNFGLGPALAQRLASNRHQESHRASDIFWTALWLNLLMGVVGALLLYSLSDFYFDRMDKLSPNLRAELDDALPIFSCIMPIVMLNSVLAGALQGRERFLITNSVAVMTSTLMALIPLAIALIYAVQLKFLIAGSVLARLLSVLFLFKSCVSAVPVTPPRRPSRELMLSLLSFGGWITVTSLAVPILVSVDRFAIGNLLGAAAVSIYQIPYTLIARLAVIPQALSGALFPRFAAVDEQNARRLEREAILALACVVTPAVVALIALARPFLDLWISKEFGAASAPLFYVLILGIWINIYARIPVTRLQGRGRPDIVGKVQIAEILPYIGLLYLAVSGYGLRGAAVAWAIRTTADAILLLYLARVPISLLRPLIVPGLATLLASVSASSLSYSHPAYWLLLTAALVVTLVWSIRNLPSSLRRTAAKIAARLAPRQGSVR